MQVSQKPSSSCTAHALTTVCLSAFPTLCLTNRHSIEVHSYFIWRSRDGLDHSVIQGWLCSIEQCWKRLAGSRLLLWNMMSAGCKSSCGIHPHGHEPGGSMVHATDSCHHTMKLLGTHNSQKTRKHLDKNTHHSTTSTTPGATVSFSTKCAGGHTQPVSLPPAGLSVFCCENLPAVTLSTFQGPGMVLSVLHASTLAHLILTKAL